MMRVRLHHVIVGSGYAAMMRGAQSGLSGGHPESGGDQPTNPRTIHEATTETGRRARGTLECHIPVSVVEHAMTVIELYIPGTRTLSQNVLEKILSDDNDQDWS